MVVCAYLVTTSKREVGTGFSLLCSYRSYCSYLLYKKGVVRLYKAVVGKVGRSLLLREQREQQKIASGLRQPVLGGFGNV